MENTALATTNNEVSVSAPQTPAISIGKFFSPEKTSRVLAFDMGVPVEIFGEGDSRTVVINDEVYDYVKPLSAFIVQTGHVSKNPALASAIGKLAYDEMGETIDVRDYLLVGELGVSRNFYVGSDSNKERACWSADGIVPSSKVMAPMSSVCMQCATSAKGETEFHAVCDKAVWSDGKRPDCQEIKHILLFDLEHCVPVKVPLRGLAISSWNKLLAYDARAKLANGIRVNVRTAQRQGKDLLEILNKQPFVVRMTMTKEDRDKGSAYVMSFKPVSAPEKEPAKFLPLVWRYAMDYIVNTPSYQEILRSNAALDAATATQQLGVEGASSPLIEEAADFEM